MALLQASEGHPSLLTILLGSTVPRVGRWEEVCPLCALQCQDFTAVPNRVTVHFPASTPCDVDSTTAPGLPGKAAHLSPSLIGTTTSLAVSVQEIYSE